MHEIVTLQFGHYANFVGTHFWNTQEAHFNYQPSAQDNDATPEPLDHDCLYRTGITNRGTETYTPRAMIFDLKGGFGSINKYRLYESESALDHYDLSWDPSKMETFQEEEYSKSAYQKHLEEEEMGITMEEGEDDIEMNEIKTWSNFSRVYFHPKSMVNVSGYQLNSEFMPFDVFSYGRSAFVETEKGFQVMADILDGWGGFATSYLEQLREDFPKATVVTYGLSDNQMRKSSTMKESQISAVNEVLSMTNLSGLSSFYIPIRAPSLSTVDTTEWSKYIQFD
ncbi:mtDNA inheritance, partitioning of the mitochondrial organelle, partial [Lobosporangium transversale]